MKSKKPIDKIQALAKAEQYCAYQERSHQEVRDKLYSYGLHKSDVEDVLTQLITSGFLSEERFAKAFAGGKFRMMKWGKNKIVNALKFRGISPRCIQTALKEIDNRDYQKTLQQLIRKKLSALKESNILKKRNKVATFVIGKGYEPDLVWDSIMNESPDF